MPTNRTPPQKLATNRRMRQPSSVLSDAANDECPPASISETAS
jgi:hypothetical protein